MASKTDNGIRGRVMRARPWKKLSGTLMTLMFFAAGATNMAAAASSDLPKEVKINDVEFLLIPEGWYYSTAGQPSDGEQHSYLNQSGAGNVKIWLDSYYIAKYEGRARDLVAYLNSPAGEKIDYFGKQKSCSTRLDPKTEQYYEVSPKEDLPATHINWKQADGWAHWMGFRLPTEMEWEKAARGSDQRTFPWGNEWPDDTYAGYRTNSNCKTWPVDAFEKGVSPYGIYNMAGNVREFVADWFNRERDKSLKDGDKNPPVAAQGTILPPMDEDSTRNDTGPWKLLKGGRWASHEHEIRIGARVFYPDDRPFRCNGTRFALDVATVKAHLAKGTALAKLP